MGDQPMDLDKIKKDTKLCAALMVHMKKGHSLENFKFYFAKGNPEALYEKYISPKSHEQVNLSSKIQRDADALAKRKDWTNKDWPRILTAAKKEIKHLVETDVLRRFYVSREYKDYSAKQRMGDPKKAASLLGIADIKLLTEAMEAAACGDEHRAEQLLKKLAKEEKLKDDAKRLLKSLEHAGFC